MLTCTTLAAAILLLAPASLAQTSLRSHLRPITGKVKNAGVMHLGTGRWTRGASDLATGPGAEIVYANTCSTEYFAGLPNGVTLIDQGAIPNMSAPSVASSAVPGGFDQNPGSASVYRIDGFTIAYCTNRPTFSAAIGFYDVGLPAEDLCAIPGTPTKVFPPVAGWPASATGAFTCWTVTIDLSASSPPESFLLHGTGGAQMNAFAWSFQSFFPSSSPFDDSGPVIAGGAGTPSPSPCTGTDGTRWDNGTASIAWPSNRLPGSSLPTALEEGTGMLNLDTFRAIGEPYVHDLGGCFWFGGDPRGSFYLELYSGLDNCSECGSVGNLYCFGDGTGATPCPCGNLGAVGAGCENSRGTGGARLDAIGSASLAHDTLTFTQTNELASTSSMLLQGDGVLPNGVVFGDGVRCVGGSLLRLYLKTSVHGAVVLPIAGMHPSVSARASALGSAIQPGDVRHYALYYRDPVPGFCPAPAGNTWNVGNGVRVAWTN